VPRLPPLLLSGASLLLSLLLLGRACWRGVLCPASLPHAKGQTAHSTGAIFSVRTRAKADMGVGLPKSIPGL